MSDSPTPPLPDDDDKDIIFAGPSCPRNLFIGGLSMRTTKDSLEEYFGKFGPIFELHLPLKDNDKTQNKGFGFMKFVQAKDAEAVLVHNEGSGTHMIDGCKVTVTMSNRPENAPVRYFISPLGTQLPEEALLNYCESLNLGKINEYCIAKESNDGVVKPRRYGYVTFANPDVDKELRELKKTHRIGGHMIRLDHFDLEKDEARILSRCGRENALHHRRRLILRRLYYKTDEKIIHRYFESFGRVRDVRVMRWRDTNRSKCFGFIEFESSESARKAVLHNNGIHTVDRVEIFADFTEIHDRNPKRKQSFSAEESNGPAPRLNDGNNNSEDGATREEIFGHLEAMDSSFHRLCVLFSKL